MHVDWASFTPWSAVIGGVIIGVAAAMLALVNGRIAGISGIVGGLLRPTANDLAWRVAFVAGLVALALFGTLGVSLDFNKLSLHYFYRDRLVETYLQTYVSRADARRDGLTRFKPSTPAVRSARLDGRPQ